MNRLVKARVGNHVTLDEKYIVIVNNVLHNYLTLMFLGNAHDSRDSFAYNCHITTNYDLISIDNIAKGNVVIDESTMTADVYGAALYIADNNYDGLRDFITLQGFFVGTEPA